MDYREEATYKPADSVIKKLYDENIFSIEKSEDGFVFTEACDYYLTVTLTKEEVLKLAKELEALANEQ